MQAAMEWMTIATTESMKDSPIHRRAAARGVASERVAERVRGVVRLIPVGQGSRPGETLSAMALMMIATDP